MSGNNKKKYSIILQVSNIKLQLTLQEQRERTEQEKVKKLLFACC